jgi:hypothetical protein
MTQDLSLHTFTSADKADDLQTYIDAPVAFDEIEQLQELKRIARKLVLPTSRVGGLPDSAQPDDCSAPSDISCSRHELDLR